MDAQLIQLERSWLLKTEFLTNHPQLLHANRCFQEPIRALGSIAWAEHTAYNAQRAEEVLAFEMSLRRSSLNHLPTESYHLQDTQTQSDYLIYEYWKKHYAQARKLLTKIHPDKFTNNKLLQPIAKFCTEYLIAD